MKYFRVGVIIVAIMLLSFSVFQLFSGPPNHIAPDGLPAQMGDKIRIVSLAPSITEIVCAVGGRKNLVGITEQCNYPEDITGVESVGSMTSPSIEKIIALRPDVVIATKTGGNRLDTALKLEEAKIPLLAISDATIDELCDSMQRIGDLLGHRRAAYSLTQNLKSAASEFRLNSNYWGEHKVLWIVARDPLFAAGTDTLYSDILRGSMLSNAVNLKGYNEISMEILLSNPPGFIFDMSGGEQGWLKKRLGENLPTIVIQLEPDRFSRPGPRLAAAIHELNDKIRASLEKARR